MRLRANDKNLAIDALRAVPKVRVRLTRRATMIIGYLALLGSALAGYTGLGFWTITVATVSLSALSRAEFAHLYDRADNMGLLDASDATMLKSMFNAFLASSAAYTGGYFFHLL